MSKFIKCINNENIEELRNQKLRNQKWKSMSCWSSPESKAERQAEAALNVNLGSTERRTDAHEPASAAVGVPYSASDLVGLIVSGFHLLEGVLSARGPRAS